MSEEYAIEVSAVSKRFKLYDNPITGPVKDYLFFWKKRKPYYKEFTAVDNISFKVKKGEVVGIIGPNGSGKTTLLKMIAGLLPVDEGEIKVRGSVTALLALGVGINPEFSGRENILFSGMLLGMSKQEVLDKTDKIVEFAELGEFIDMPFRTYSSGMQSRLLFSISMSMDPDILIVDEALATGDAHFVNKCMDRIREICENGATILYVTHNLTQMAKLCDRAILVMRGKVRKEGSPEQVISLYNEWNFEKEKTHAPLMGLNKMELVSGSGDVVLKEVTLLNSNGKEENGFFTGENMRIQLSYESRFPAPVLANVFIGLIRSKDNEWAGEINTRYFVEEIGGTTTKMMVELDREGAVCIDLNPVLLLNGHYSLWIIIYSGDNSFCEYKKIKPFFIGRQEYSMDTSGAMFWQPCKMSVKSGRELEHAGKKDT